jgi:hypothetical protein
MKEWFKYEFGYVNVDAHNLYLTNTGNWSETIHLKEKASAVSVTNSSKNTYIIVYIALALVTFAFLFFKNMLSAKPSLLLVAITVGGGYKLYQYMKREIGAKFKIPVEKIQEIRLEENNAVIIFITETGDADRYNLVKVEKKGLEILQTLNNPRPAS